MAAKIPPKVGKIVDVLVSIGAAVVLFGALQKLMHTKLADLFLQIGLYSEAFIFLGYGVLYMYYPAMDENEVHVPGLEAAGKEVSPIKAMEKMMKEADITPANLGKLSAGFEKFGSTVSQISDLGDVVKSTGDFSNKTKEAATALSSVAGAVNQATVSLGAFNEASESTKQFHGQVQVLTKNLASLNTIYELELQESNNHLKVLNNFYGKLADASQAMEGTAEDAEKAKQQIAALAGNLTRLNQVYGNMLTAMSGR
ncbi:MAG: gliding motility protein GldL [Chitinophagaceae bacterium]|nr:gliding motility protein GldL [Chitinophagaceae bacterium]